MSGRQQQTRILGIPLQHVTYSNRTDGIGAAGRCEGLRVYAVFRTDGRVRVTVVRDIRTFDSTLADNTETATQWVRQATNRLASN